MVPFEICQEMVPVRAKKSGNTKKRTNEVPYEVNYYMKLFAVDF